MASISNPGTSNMTSLGQYGSFYATHNTAVTVPSGFDIVALQMVGSVATSFSTLTRKSVNCTTATSVAFPVGSTIFGRWSAATVSNTSDMGVIAYFAPSL